MDLSSKLEGPFKVVSVEETRIDAAVAIEFKNAMRQETEDGIGTIVLNLTSVNFIDSSGLGAIVAIMKNLGSNRKLALAGLTPPVDKVFKLTRMDSVFAIYPTLDEARDAIGNAA